jgi:hypothetical protein
MLKENRGLGVRTSLVRYSDPGLLLAYPDKVRKWRAAGGTTRFLRLPEEIGGNEAVAHNRRTNETAQAYDIVKTGWRRILGDLFSKLADVRLIAFGSPDSSLNLEEPIRAVAWKHLNLHDLKRSTVREGKREKRRLIFNVSIYPVLEAPCAADLLAGQSLAKAIEQYVLGDPEVSSLLKRIGKDGTLATKEPVEEPSSATQPH